MPRLQTDAKKERKKRKKGLKSQPQNLQMNLLQAPSIQVLEGIGVTGSDPGVGSG